MNSLLKKYFPFAMLIAVIVISISCKRRTTCNETLVISGPKNVVEGESFTLTPTNYDETQHVNTNYYWFYPESTGWAYSSGNSEEFLEPESISVSKADKRHEGLYMFSIDSGHDKCSYEDGVVSHEINIIPKECPCFNDISTNQLIIDDSNENDSFTYSFSPDYQLDWDSIGFRVKPILPMFSYELYVDIELYPPDYSSTYMLKNTDNWPIAEPLVEANISFQPDYTSSNYILASDNQEVYFKRESDGFYLTFCNVNFVNENFNNQTATVSGKIKISL